MTLLDLYGVVDLTLARFSRFIPVRLYQWLERVISRRELNLLRGVPPEWLAEGPDGFQPESMIDIVFGHGAPNPGRRSSDRRSAASAEKHLLRERKCHETIDHSTWCQAHFSEGRSGRVRSTRCPAV
jgi:hypothetical protein